MHRDKYDVQPPEPRASLTERLYSYYGNIRGMLLGAIQTGRRTNLQQGISSDDTHITSFKKDQKGNKESKEEGQLLKTKSVDIQRSINRYEHRTSDYEIPNLILRRGKAFEIKINFDLPFNEDHDEITLKFVTGRVPLQSKGTVVPVHKVKNLLSGQWGFQVLGVQEKSLTVKVISAPDAIVGRYQLFVDTKRTSHEGIVEKSRFGHPDDIYIIFNPWCPDDIVYLEDESQRQEYVLNETGRIWLGTVGRFCVRPWNFAQFDDVCLVAALALMEKTELGDPARRSPLLVVRALSNVINNNERDGGVLIGNWSGKYDDGVAPYTWNGSAAILEEFLKKRKGVKYGQCWTFAAVATTVFRALGIPTRCVTNFKSAHDSDYSTPIDTYWSMDGRPRKNMDDGVWDFHVWNESWMNRTDLPPGNDGWQAYDPTPQECYEGVFTCGPAPVSAVKHGELYLGYESKFLFAEVNGSRVHWMVDSEGNMTVIGVEVHLVGRCISTKAVNTISREDLTSSYKSQEGSGELEEALNRGRPFCFRRVPSMSIDGPNDVEFVYKGDSLRTGDVNVCMTMKNTSIDTRVVEVHISAVASRYTGIPVTDLNFTNATNVIEPDSESQVALTVKCSDYINSVDCDSHINIYVMALVKETNQRHIQRETYWLEKPHLDLKSDRTAQLGKPFDVSIKLVNPLGVPLTNGVIYVEGPGMQRIAAVKVKKSISSGEEIRETIQVKPRRLGRKEIIANFHCKQMCDVTGVTEVEIIDDTKV
ncbi:hypothetical protein ScPMuIL_001664 [Solemya velum]